jgi:hypothetical protein
MVAAKCVHSRVERLLVALAYDDVAGDPQLRPSGSRPIAVQPCSYFFQCVTSVYSGAKLALITSLLRFAAVVTLSELGEIADIEIGGRGNWSAGACSRCRAPR